VDSLEELFSAIFQICGFGTHELILGPARCCPNLWRPIFGSSGRSLSKGPDGTGAFETGASAKGISSPKEAL